MFAIVLALVAAACWGLSAVLVRTGLRYLTPTVGTLISLVSALALTAVLVVALQLPELLDVSLQAVAMFALIGILNFPMGRFLNYLAMSHLGVGRSTPLLASAPLFAVLGAVVFTGEELHLATVAGIGLIIGGLYVTLTAKTG
ncbi:MAG: DMT family transporter [Dehalococcoidia bacterium]|nr:DMT family transporter [Dehalococcoidia bacterium]